MDEPQSKLQKLSEDFEKLQSELQTNVEARQKLESQQQESKGVQKEFAKLSQDAGIYKLVGPVLLKQDRNEATMAVDQRLEFIEKELIDQKIKVTEAEAEKKRSESFSIQASLQQQESNAKVST